MGVHWYRIFLWVFNLIAHQLDVKLNTKKEKFHIYKQPCIILFNSYKHDSPLLTKKVDFHNKWK